MPIWQQLSALPATLTMCGLHEVVFMLQSQLQLLVSACGAPTELWGIVYIRLYYGDVCDKIMLRHRDEWEEEDK